MVRHRFVARSRPQLRRGCLSEALAQEVAGFGIKVTVAEPGGYTTEGLTGGVSAEPNPLYDEQRTALVAYVSSVDFDDPAGAGRAILELADAPNPPLHVFLGQGYELVRRAYADRLKTWADWQDLSMSAR